MLTSVVIYHSILWGNDIREIIIPRTIKLILERPLTLHSLSFHSVRKINGKPTIAPDIRGRHERLFKSLRP